MMVTDEDIDNFITITHQANSGRTAAAKALIPTNVVVTLKAILFELRDRQMCSALPDEQVLQGINIQQLSVMRNKRNKTMEMVEIRKNQSYPEMVVPTLNSTN